MSDDLIPDQAKVVFTDIAKTCSEIEKTISKILVEGLKAPYRPDIDISNIQYLEIKLGFLKTLLKVSGVVGVVDMSSVDMHARLRLEELKHFQRKRNQKDVI